MRIVDFRVRHQSIAAAMGTIALGLLSRRVHVLPTWLAKDVGDALYATLIYCLAYALVPTIQRRFAFVASFLFSTAVEVSQTVHPDWLDALRNTTLGGLALGHGFHFRDIGCYFAGACLGVAIDALSSRELRRRMPRDR